MSQNDLFHSLLRPAVLHILRATGFHHGRPSAVDALVDVTARYLSLLAERTAYNAFSNHNDATPDTTDVRMALQDCALLIPSLTAAEELWREMLRKPLAQYDAHTAARQVEAARRDAEDTADIAAFIAWVTGDQHREIRRIAGTYKPAAPGPPEPLDALEMEDYLNSLMKKHSKTGVAARFQGTALGLPAEPRPVKIEGGAADSIDEWCRRTRERAANTAPAPQHERRAITSHGDPHANEPSLPVPG